MGATKLLTAAGGGVTLDAASTATDKTITIPADNGTMALTSQLNGFRNRILNGDMRIDQRNAGASVTPTTDDTYTLDRWAAGINVASKFSIQQNAGSVTPPAGFRNYLGVTSLSAYSIAAGDVMVLKQTIEGFNVADLNWGTANAQSVTLSFWVRSSLTGTFGGTFMNSAQNRAYPFTYTISSANTWEQKSITITGDTTGTWVTNNGAGIKLGFQLGVGSTFTGTAGSWTANNYWGATGATSVVGTNGATFYITGVQLEKGTTATPFEVRPYGMELALCQRYYSLNTPGAGRSTSTTRMSGTVGTPVPMRATPTVSLFSGTNKAIDVGVAFRNVTAVVALEGATEYGGNIQADLSTTNSGTVHTYLGGCFAWSAEL